MFLVCGVQCGSCTYVCTAVSIFLLQAVRLRLVGLLPAGCIQSVPDPLLSYWGLEDTVSLLVHHH